MSDTDDTDVLLLIPPDFFLVHSDSDEYESYNGVNSSAHFTTVDHLITQVYKLENRVNKIEFNTENNRFSSLSSNNSTIIPVSEMSDDVYRNQDLYHSDYIPSSAKSTPQKPRTKLVIGPASLPTTPSSFRHRRPLFRSKINNRIPPEGIGDAVPSTASVEDHRSELALEKLNNKEILCEIDKFLSSVKTIEASVQEESPRKDEKTDRNVPIKFDNPAITLSELNTLEESSKRFSNLNLNDVNRLLYAIENQQVKLNTDDNKIESLYENKSFTTKDSWTHKKEDGTIPDLEDFTTTDTSLISKQAWNCGDNINSVPNLRFGMRDILYKNHQSADDVLIKNNVESEKRSSKQSDTYSDSEISEPTVVETRKQMSNTSVPFNPNKGKYNLNKSSNTPKNISFNESAKESDGMQSLPSNLSTFSLQQFSRETCQPNINLFSLTDIWNIKTGQDNLITDSNDARKLLPKLEEEKCRRKHCEKLISELQMKILEMQQRLAVAIQVDSAKDEAILRFHEAWEKVANRWKSLETERNSLSNKLLTIEEKSSTEIAEANQKVVHAELEISKALDLAHCNQEKCTSLEKGREELLKKMKQIAIQLKSSQESIIDLTKYKDDLNNKISLLEKESLKDKKLLLEAQDQITKTKNANLSSQSELAQLKNENTKLQSKLKENQNILLELETQKNNLNISIEALQKNEETMQKEMKYMQEETERLKIDLRNFYQQQVEVLVKDKLKEFQQQLEQAEKSLQDELHLKEQNIAKQAAKQVHKLTEKHRVEIHLVEEKHKEEIRLYELQSNQMKQQINVLQNKLDGYHAKQSNIAEELHNVMEAQWLEALRIINHSKSPVVDHFEDRKSKIAVDTNIEEINKILKAKENISSSAAAALTTEQPKFNYKDTMKLKTRHTITDQASIPSNRAQNFDFETPVSSKAQYKKEKEASHLNETELQTYIRQLLDKMPIQSENIVKQDQNIEFGSQESSTSDLNDMPSTWQQAPIEQDQDRFNSNKDRSNKPPWK